MISQIHKLYLGMDENYYPLFISRDTLTRHISIFGQTGSGKTVLLKEIIEEATMFHIPSIIIDIEGDISSMIIPRKIGDMENDYERDRFRLFHERAEIRIFTPLSNAGIPLSINPIKYLMNLGNIDEYKQIQYIDFVANHLLNILHIKGDKFEDTKRYLYHAIEDCVGKPDLSLELIIENIEDEKTQKMLKKASKKLSYGVNKLIYSDRDTFNIKELLTPTRADKTPINIINLSSLIEIDHRRSYILDIATMIYEFMLSNINRQVFFALDEAKEFIPPNPYQPPTKSVIQALFKRGRKSNVYCCLATQNAKDVDYHIFGQSNTLFVGKIRDKADLDVMREVVKSYDGGLEILEKLPTMKIGELFVFSPENFEQMKMVRLRRLYCKHRKISDSEIKQRRIKCLEFQVDKKNRQISFDEILRRCGNCGDTIGENTVCDNCGHIND